MSLKSYFPEQFDLLKDFMVSAVEVVHCVRIDPEMKSMINKALVKMEDDSEFPHVLLDYSEPFKDPDEYFAGLYDLLSTQYVQNSQAFAEQDIHFKTPFDEKNPPPTPFQFLKYAEALTESLPEHVGSLVFVLDPEEITDQDGFRRTVKFLADKTKSDWLKFVILDARTDPIIELPSDDDIRMGHQTFHLSPEEIEQRTKEDLETPAALESSERRQYKGLLAGFAFARKEYDDAEKFQRQWLEGAESEGQPAEVATALYNLGNTLIAKEAFSDATDVYCRASDICIDEKLAALTPLVYTNLGISLHRQGNFDQAFASLKVARDMFKAQNMRPAEAYVVDCLAQMYVDDGHIEKAESAWRHALSLYDSITASQFEDLREVGRSGILDKLERLNAKPGQKDNPETAEQSNSDHASP